MSDNKKVNIDHAGTKEYREMLEQIQKDGICPFCVDFCEGKSPTYHPNPILVETNWWVITENVRKYKGVVHQFLLVPKVHVTKPWELADEVWSDLKLILEKISKLKNLSAGSFVMRFGDTDFTGGTVTHLHAQIVVGVSRKESSEPLLVYCGYQKPE